MISLLITFLVVVLVAYVIFYCVGLFLPGVPQKIVGIILGLVVLLYALKLFGVALP